MHYAIRTQQTRSVTEYWCKRESNLHDWHRSWGRLDCSLRRRQTKPPDHTGDFVTRPAATQAPSIPAKWKETSRSQSINIENYTTFQWTKPNLSKIHTWREQYVQYHLATINKTFVVVIFCPHIMRFTSSLNDLLHSKAVPRKRLRLRHCPI